MRRCGTLSTKRHNTLKSYNQTGEGGSKNREAALNLRPEQIKVLERQYKAESAYYFKGQSAFRDILARLDSIREDLRATSLEPFRDGFSTRLSRRHSRHG